MQNMAQENGSNSESATNPGDNERAAYVADLQERYDQGERFSRVQYMLGEYSSRPDGTYMVDEFGRLLYTVQNQRVVTCSYPDQGEYVEESWELVRQKYTVIAK